MFTEEDNKKCLEEIFKNVDLNEMVLGDTEDDSELISNHISSEISEAAVATFAELKSNMAKQLKPWHKVDNSFNKRLNKRWKRPLDLLDLLIITSLDAGETFNKEMRPLAIQKNDFVFEALCRLHARACLVSREIIHLMKGGYASGALSRWRTLHEIAVVGYFVKKHGNDVAERYLLYQAIDSYKAMLQYGEHAEKLENDPYSEEEIKCITEARDDLIDRFGTQYGKPNGWAIDALNKKRVDIYDIERESGIGHLRPYYKLASHSIHAGSKGCFFDIGLSEYNGNVMMAGPSDEGLVEPGSLMAMSLSQITTCFLLLTPTVNGLIYLKTIQLLVEEINAELSKVCEHTPAQTNTVSEK